VKVGVIGTGVMGQNHSRVYSETKGIEDVVLFDAAADSAQKTAKRLGVKTAPSLDKLLDEVDAVSICVPTQYHKDTAITVIDSGVAALIEKPVCSTVSEAEFLIDHVPPGAIVGVAHIERFNPIIPEIVKILDKPVYISIHRHNPAFGGVIRTPVIEDLMIHDIDIAARYFLKGDYALSASGTDDVMGVLFNNQNTTMYLSASRKASKKVKTIYIEQEDLSIEGNFMTQEVYIHQKPGVYQMDNDRYVQENVVKKIMVQKVEPLKLELQTFLACVREKTPFPVTLEEAAENLRICNEIHLAAGVP